MLIIHSVTYFREKTLNYDCITVTYKLLVYATLCVLHVAAAFFTMLLWFASVVAPFESVESDH